MEQKKKLYTMPEVHVVVVAEKHALMAASNPNEVKVNTNGEKFDASQALSREAEPRSVWDD